MKILDLDKHQIKKKFPYSDFYIHLNFHVDASTTAPLHNRFGRHSHEKVST